MPAAGSMRIDLYAGTRQFERGMARARRTTTNFSAGVRKAGGAGKGFNQRMVEGSRAIDDISAGFATAGVNATGFALALRGAQNNVTAMLAVTHPLLAAITGIGFALGAVLLKRLSAAGKEMDSMSEKAEKLTAKLDALIQKRRQEAGLPPLNQGKELLAIPQARRRFDTLLGERDRLQRVIREEKAQAAAERSAPRALQVLAAIGRAATFNPAAGSVAESFFGSTMTEAKAQLEKVNKEIEPLAKQLNDFKRTQNEAIIKRNKEDSAFLEPILFNLKNRAGSAANGRIGLLASLAANPIAALLRFRVPEFQAVAGRNIGGPLGGRTDAFAQAIERRSAGARSAIERGKGALKSQKALDGILDNTETLIDVMKQNVEAVKRNVLRVFDPVG